MRTTTETEKAIAQLILDERKDGANTREMAVKYGIACELNPDKSMVAAGHIALLVAYSMTEAERTEFTAELALLSKLEHAALKMMKAEKTEKKTNLANN